LARLGLRAGEIVALELDDISWDTGKILARGKCGRASWLMESRSGWLLSTGATSGARARS
jgi:integrase